jgi:transcriptional regulator with XRE-family HTH domain
MRMEALRDWLTEECNRRNLSWREASVRAGVYPGAVSAIMNGQRPGLEVCKAMARSFGTPPEYVLRLAGHLPPQVDPADIDPELRHTADELLALWRRLKVIDPESAERLQRIAVLQAEMVMAAARAGGLQAEGEPEQERTGTNIALA